MSSYKKDLKGTVRQVFICLRPRTPDPPPPLLHTVYGYTVYRVLCTYSHREGREGGELSQREGERGNRSQSWVENTNMADYMSNL